jgi:hypothetical protein
MQNERKSPKLSTFPVIHILWTWDFKDFALYIFRGPPTVYLKLTISEIDPLLDEKSLFVRVPGLSGAVGRDSNWWMWLYPKTSVDIMEPETVLKTRAFCSSLERECSTRDPSEKPVFSKVCNWYTKTRYYGTGAQKSRICSSCIYTLV